MSLESQIKVIPLEIHSHCVKAQCMDVFDHGTVNCIQNNPIPGSPEDGIVTLLASFLCFHHFSSDIT